ncbi:MAG: pre-peptidase C-terminal domain-containing protein [Saprospiraceae bacterium]|nr:pre-peptidase C-terminal domain-containing protein [Saprospiraceae bacterium]
MKIRLTTVLLILTACWPLKSWCQPVNDDPCGALVLSAMPGTNCTPTQPLSWTNATATPNLPHPGCASYSTGDVWFTFTLNETSNIFITTTAGMGGNAVTDGGMALYTADDCTGNLVKLDCDDDDGSGNMPQISLFSQPPGQYYIRFWDYYDATSGNIGGICLATLPVLTNVPNDNPCEAIELSPTLDADTCDNFNPFSWSGATLTQGFSLPECIGFITTDVWFKFTIPDTSFVYITTLAGEGPNGVTNGVMAVYAANSCSDGFIEIECNNNTGDNLMPSIQIPALLPGEYYIRFWNFTNTFEANIGGICVAANATENLEYVVNDDPCNAIVLNINNDSICTADNVQSWALASATPNIPDPPCGSYDTGDIWYSFSLAEASRIAIHTSAGTDPFGITDGAMALYYADACNGNFNLVICDDDSGPGNMPLIDNQILQAGTYYIRFWDYSNSISGNIGGICVAAQAVAEVVPNDNCTTAIPFPDIPANGACASVQANTLYAGGTPSNNCDGIADDDVWFTFTVPADVTMLFYSITANGQSVDQGIRIYSGNCNELVSIACSTTSEGVISDLTPGQTYYLRTYTIPNDDGAIYDICLSAFQAPVNDEPCGAITIPVTNGDICDTNNPQSWIFASATQGLALPECGSYSNGDVWFSFVLDAKSDIRVQTQAGTGSQGITDGAMMLYYSTSCNELTPINCNDDKSPQNYMPEILEYALIPGTYYIRFWDYNDNLSGNIGGICVAAKPSVSEANNDICVSAESFPPILPDQSCSIVDVNTALATGNDDPNTTVVEDDDLWYKFTVPPATFRLLYEITTISGNSQQGINLYENCGDSNPILYWYEINPDSGIFYDLIPGQTYYMQVFTLDDITSSHFRICLKTQPPPPANDLCSNALSFPTIPEDGTCVGVTVHSQWAGNNSFNCSSFENGDVWYRFTVPGNTTALMAQIEVQEGSLDFPGFQVLSGDCNNLIPIGCYNNDLFTSLHIQGLTPGASYFLRAYTLNNQYDQLFDICLGVAPPTPPNDLCANAIPFPGIPTDGTCATMHIDTYGATGDGDNGCFNGVDDDVWYSFTVPVGYTGLLAERSNFGALQIENITIYEGTCGNLTPFSCHSQGETWISGLTGGQTYFLSASSLFANESAAFDLCLKTYPNNPIPNDECPGATAFPAIAANGSWVQVQGLTLGATASGQPSCDGYPDDDLWYSFVVPTGYTSILYQINSESNGLTLELLTGDCDNLLSLGCFDNNETTHFPGLIPDQTYYLRVYSQSEHDFLTFTISLKTPGFPLNDECETAIAFPVLPTDGTCISIHGNTALATGIPYSTCVGDESDDLWYSFVAPDDRTIAIFDLIWNFGGKPSLQLFHGNCNNLEVFECFSGFPQTDDFSYLTPGERYYVRVYSRNANVSTDFNLCMAAGPLPPVNDNCENAVSVAEAPGVFISPGFQSLSGATISSQLMCAQQINNILPFDMWYSFVTDSDGGNAIISAFETNDLDFYYYQYFELGLEVFSGECGDFETLWCGTAPFELNSDTVRAVIYNLLPNTRYYFRVFGNTQSGGYTTADFMVDVRGTALSPITDVDELAPEANNAWKISKVFPSPTTDNLFVQYHAPESEITRLYIIDMMGRAVLQREFAARAGENRESVPVQQLAPGMYFVFIAASNGRSEAVRFVKE